MHALFTVVCYVWHIIFLFKRVIFVNFVFDYEPLFAVVSILISIFLSTGNHRSASLTSDGQHIVSTSEDSHVYIWNCINQEVLSPSQPKTIRSWERFTANASIAIPWSGLKSENSGDGCQVRVLDETSLNLLPSPVCFAVGQEFVLESFPKGSATWPEEKLLSSSPWAVPSAIHKSQYKFLRSSCQSTSSSHAWNLVIVTAGWDGRIRSFHNYGLPVAFWCPKCLHRTSRRRLSLWSGALLLAHRNYQNWLSDFVFVGLGQFGWCFRILEFSGGHFSDSRSAVLSSEFMTGGNGSSVVLYSRN